MEFNGIKRCSKCKEEKIIEEYYKNNQTKDGYLNKCKACCKERENSLIHIKVEEKKCCRCKEIKKSTEFYKRKSSLDGLYYRCIKCEKLRVNSEKKKRQRRYRDIERKYGMSSEEYEQTLKMQNGHCAICPKNKNLCIDHDHNTGKTRAILCEDCNRSLGMFEDNPQYLLNAADYLNYHAGRIIQDITDV